MRPLPLVVFLLSLAVLSPAARATDLLPIAVPETGPIRGISARFSIAFGAEGGVAVWKVGFGALWGAPLDLNGRQTAPARWILSETNGFDLPEVRFDDGSFVLWWIRSYPRATRVARLDAELRPIAPQTIAVSSTPPLASNEAVYLLTDGRFPSSYDITVYFIDRNFARLRSESLSELGAIYSTAAVALADRTFALVAAGERGRFLIRYSPDGERLGAPQLIDAQKGTGIVATDGVSILVAGVIPPPPSGFAQLSTLLIRSDGSTARFGTPVPWRSVGLDVQWGGGAYTIAVAAGTVEGQTTDEADLYASRLSPEGELLSEFTPILVRPGLETRFDLVRAGSGLVLAFEEGGYGTGVLFAIALPTAGSLARPDTTVADARISDAAAIQSSAYAASDGVGWMIVWKESTATSDQIRSVLLDRDGRPVTPPMTHASGGIFQLGGVNVTFDGIDYVVTWIDWSQLHVRRFRRDGSPVAPQPIVVAHDVGGFPKMASKDGVTLVAWNGVRGMLLYADGRTTPPVLLTPAPHRDGEEYISYGSEIVAAGENGFLVGFTEERAFPCGFPGSCRSEYRAQAQLFSREGEKRGALMTFDAKGVSAGAGAGGTFLLALDSGRGVVIVAASATVTRTFPLTRATAVFETGGEYTAVTDEGETLLVRRMRSDGTVIRTEEAELDGRAAAASASGALFVIGGRAILDAPHYGSPAVIAGVADTFTAATSDRRRAVTRAAPAMDGKADRGDPRR